MRGLRLPFVGVVAVAAAAALALAGCGGDAEEAAPTESAPAPAVTVSVEWFTGDGFSIDQPCASAAEQDLLERPIWVCYAPEFGIRTEWPTPVMCWIEIQGEQKLIGQLGVDGRTRSPGIEFEQWPAECARTYDAAEQSPERPASLPHTPEDTGIAYAAGGNEAAPDPQGEPFIATAVAAASERCSGQVSRDARGNGVSNENPNWSLVVGECDGDRWVAFLEKRDDVWQVAILSLPYDCNVGDEAKAAGAPPDITYTFNCAGGE